MATSPPGPRSFTPSVVRVKSGLAPLAILVVEDDEDFGTYLADLLADVGHEPTWVRSAEGAVERLAVAVFDVVLTDVRLDGRMSGLALAQQLREARRAEVVIVMTAFGTAEVVETAFASGAVGCLSKPFRTSELLGCIQLGILRSLREARP